MRATPNLWRVLLFGVLLLALAVPPNSLRALAGQQQEGQQKPPEEKKPEYSISVEAPLVNVDAVVTNQDGDILTGLKKQNFRVLDDGVPQTITNFAPTEAPITIVMLVEFSRVAYGFFSYTGTYWSYDFLNHLNKEDWVALETFDLKPHVAVDFTQNKIEVQDAIAHLYFPTFSESNLWDAILDTLDRLKDVKGKKSILVVASGFDTFSKHTYDQALKQLKQTEVTIFCVGTGEFFAVRQAGGSEIGYLQAQNQLQTVARLTGGYAWFPRFDGEIPGIFNSVAGFLRNQYTIGYSPSNGMNDGKFHKIKVEVVDDNGQPLVLTDRKGKKKKTIVYFREGYQAPKGPVGD